MKIQLEKKYKNKTTLATRHILEALPISSCFRTSVLQAAHLAGPTRWHAPATGGTEGRAHEDAPETAYLTAAIITINLCPSRQAFLNSPPNIQTGANVKL